MIDEANAERKDEGHLVLEGPHPSPLSAYSGFFGGHYFSKANEYLRKHDMDEIDWDIKSD